jgi:hypothetical protein
VRKGKGGNQGLPLSVRQERPFPEPTLRRTSLSLDAPAQSAGASFDILFSSGLPRLLREGAGDRRDVPPVERFAAFARFCFGPRWDDPQFSRRNVDA